MNQLPLPTLSRADQYAEQFKDFDAANPQVWELFQQFAFDVMRVGHKRYSSDAILHRIRWHATVEVVGGKPFKINDHWSRYYAEKWHREYPAYADLFEMRTKPSETRLAN